MKLPLRNIIIIVSCNIIVGYALVSQRHWLQYGWHLVKHQYIIFTQRIQIDKLILSPNANFSGLGLDQEQADKLKLIREVKGWGKKIFHLQQSNSFDSFVDLKREALGFNVVTTDEFSLQADEVSLPLLGRFGYLGFFDKEVMNLFLDRYRKKNKDIYISEIAAYSTLGILPDPLFSTYLYQNKSWLVELILHEMAHEKLWIKNDTDFNEMFASYVGRRAAQIYFKDEIANSQEGQAPPNTKYQRQRESVFEIIEKTKTKLQELYAKDIAEDIAAKDFAIDDKRQQKKQIYQELFIMIEKDSLQFNDKKYHQYLLGQKDSFNNALLIQFRRYSPSHNNFDYIFEKICANDKDNFECFFREISFLQDCSRSQRQELLFARSFSEKTLKDICLVRER